MNPKSECCELCRFSYFHKTNTEPVICNHDCHLPKPMDTEKWEEEFYNMLPTFQEFSNEFEYGKATFKIKSFISSQISQAKAEGYKQGMEAVKSIIMLYKNEYDEEDKPTEGDLLLENILDKLKKLICAKKL